MLRSLVSGSDTLIKINGEDRLFINFDNAATTPPLNSVIDSINKFSPYYSSVHRGGGLKSEISSTIYENARKEVLNFLNGDESFHTVIFLKNTTECINKLANRLKDQMENKIVLITYMEHHSNMLPWREKFKTDYIEVDSVGRLCLEDLEFKLQLYGGNVGLVCLAGASNVTGYINDIHKAADLCHKYGAKILVDGAQMIPHMAFDMKILDDSQHIDFVAFSAHKMYAPFGIGALVAPKELFSQGHSEIVGGGTVKFVSKDDVIWEDPPAKEEAGTPNLMGVLALTEAIRTMQTIGMNLIEDHERGLIAYALYHLRKIPKITLYDDFNIDDKVSIISFNLEEYHHLKLAEILNHEEGISVRNGCFCAQPYVQRLLKISKEEMMKYRELGKEQQPGMVRLSFGFYNDYYEIDRLLDALNRLAK